MTIFLILNYHKASIYAKHTTKLPRLPMGLIWSLILRFCAKLSNICSYEQKLAIKCTCFLPIWYHTFPDILRKNFTYRDASQLSGILTKRPRIRIISPKWLFCVLTNQSKFLLAISRSPLHWKPLVGLCPIWSFVIELENFQNNAFS